MGGVKSKNKIPTARFIDYPKSAKKGDLINIEMTQNVFLVWLDADIDEYSVSYENTISHFRSAINNINTFTDEEKCIQFLEDIGDEKVCMIISGALGQQIMPRVHDLSQLDSIFIFCSNKKYHKRWVKDWSKIKGIYTDIERLCEALKKIAEQCEQNAISISIIGGRDGAVERNKDRLDPSFMYTQIMKAIFLTIDFKQEHIDQFIQYCHEVLADNQKQLHYVKELAKQYHQQQSIWWYTRDTFLYSMLNRALRVMDTNVIIKLGFFISDLHRHIEQLQAEQFGNHEFTQHFTLYRGQGMEKKDFEKMGANKGGLISFNSFLSTSKVRSTSLTFAERALQNVQLVGVLFVMNIDSKRSSTPFAFVNDVGYFGARENEVLFSMHTVFRIEQVIPINGNLRLFQVQLTLTSDQDNDLCELADYIRQQTFPNPEGWYPLGELLEKLGQLKEAQYMYDKLLSQATDESEQARIYHGIGRVKSASGEYIEAIRFYEQAFAIYEKTLPSNHPCFAASYNNIALVYDQMGDYSQALSFHEKALDMEERTRSRNFTRLTTSHNNLGGVYDNMGEYTLALSHYRRTLAIREKVLRSDTPGLATSYNNVAVMYNQIGDFSGALFYHQEALTIKEKTLPSNHPGLATSYNNIGGVYNNLGEYSQALSFHQKALTIYEITLPPNHPDLATSYSNIGRVYDNMGKHSQALSFHQKTLTTYEINPPSDPSRLATCYCNIGGIYDQMGECSQALSFYQKALTIREKTLPSNHPSLADSHSEIGEVYEEMDKHSQALCSHQQALAIKEKILSSDHPDLATSYSKIGRLYDKMGEFSQALSFQQKALAIYEKTLPSNHHALAISYSNIGGIYDQMGKYFQALYFHQRTLAIDEKTLPSNHPVLATSYSKIGRVYDEMGKYSQALSFHQRALALREKALPPDHHYLAVSYDNLGKVYYHTEDYERALSLYNKALQIGEKALSSNHPKLAWYCNDIGMVYSKKGDHFKALLFYRRALEVGECSLPSAHPHLQLYRNNVTTLQD